MVLRKSISHQVRAAFTLVELVVVMAIIVALAGVGGFYYMQQMEESYKRIATTQCKSTLTQAVTTYRVDNGDWPQNLEVLLQKTEDGHGPYLMSRDALMDPWGRPYNYNVQGPNNNGMQPDIWADSPQGGIQCGNWPKLR